MLREDGRRSPVYRGEDVLLLQKRTNPGRGGDLTVARGLLGNPTPGYPLRSIAQARQFAMDFVAGVIARYRDRAPGMLVEIPAARSGFLERA